MTTVWHNFQANTYSKKSSTRLFWGLLEQKDACCGGSSKGFCEKYNLAVVRGSETQTNSKERGIVVASLLRGIINYQAEAMREADISAFALPCSGTMR